MLKLLTDEGREKVSGEYKVRRVVVIILALIVITIITIIGLLPSYVLSGSREEEALARLRLTESGDQKEGQELRAWLAETNKRLSTIAPNLDTDKPSDFIARVIALKPSGIKITGFSWTKAKDKVTLSLSGTALDRQTLVRFENEIEASGLFSDITLPISDLAKDRNIGFQIKFSPL